MGISEVPQDRQKGLGVPKFLFCSGIIGTRFNWDYRVVFHERLVKQGNMAHDAQSIGFEAQTP